MNAFINSQQWCQWSWLNYSFLALDTGSKISKIAESCPAVSLSWSCLPQERESKA